ncbi:MAG: cytochrome c [Steroidobacter sp.]
MSRTRAGNLLSAGIVVMTVASLLSTAASAADHDDAASTRGRQTFETYCVLCHGSAGKGDGRGAALQKVRPSDLTASSRSDDYKVQIISNGGAFMKRSEGMPPWKTVLSREQIADVVVYLRGMAERSDARSAAEAKARAKREQG